MTVSAHRPAVFSLLTSHIQLCLAHYCDLHGPTPLMVTEGLPVPCARCSDDNLDDAASSRSGAASSTTATSPGTPAPVTAALRKMNLDSAQSDSATVPEQDAQTNRAAPLRASKTATKPSAQSTTPNASAVQTPPQSPRRNADGFADTKSNANSSQRDCSFQRTYDESVTKHANPCANCSLTLPKRQDAERAGNKSDKAMNPRSDPQGPTMRTRAPYARVYGSPVDTSPPRSNPQSSYTSDAEEDATPSKSTSRTSSQRRPTTSTSQSSAMSKGSVPHHTHYLDYTSTHEPTVPTTFTIVRASCLRTLSLETLPRRPEATQSSPSLHGPPPSIPPSMNVGPGYITAPPTPQPASSGGPILFGDATAGYTTAYIFRIPDMHARGRKRVYAFLALSTHRERLAMKAFSFISAAFRDLAAWIQELVEAEAEREREREEGGSAVAALNAAYGTGGFGGRGPHDSGIGLGGGLSGRSMERSIKDRDRDTSSFLSGGGRSAYMQRMGGSMGPSGFTPKARGLAELAGLPDFFIELHTRFVKLLLELGVVLGS